MVGGNGPGAIGCDYLQVCKKLGDLMVIAVGDYDLWLQPEDGSAPSILEKKLHVKAGVITDID